MSEPWRWTALEMARALRRRELSSLELTQACLARIAEHNPRLNAFVRVLAGQASRAARRADKRLASSEHGELPAFEGVPCAIKDLNMLAGACTSFGSRSYRYLWSPVDGPVTKRVRQGGFVLLGKLATSEFGAMPVTEPDIHPPTSNPWHTGHSAGGSSGGSGSAVAAGLLPMAQASDGAGSIRIPAALCHLFGFKPSRSYLPDPHGRGGQVLLSCVGPISHSVEDAAALLDVMVGRTHLLPEAPEGSLLERCNRPPPSLKVFMCTDNPMGPIDAERVAAVERVGGWLRELGHRVEPRPVLRAELEDFLPLWQSQLAGIPVLYEGWLQPVTRWLRAGGRGYSAAEVLAVRDRLAARVLQWCGGADLMLCPTVAIAAPPIGAWRDLEPEQHFRAAAQLGVFTAPFNVSGQPAASIPCGLDGHGLPIGVQLVGRSGRDGRLLAVCRQLERAHPWTERRAPDFFPPRDAPVRPSGTDNAEEAA